MRLQGFGTFIIKFIVNFYFTAILFQKSVCDETSGIFCAAPYDLLQQKTN